MGCGSSSLKGEEPNGLNSQPAKVSEPTEQPIKKVRTNFADVDYDQSGQNRRMTEYAPHEQVTEATRPRSKASAGTAPDSANPAKEELKPYHTLEDDRDNLAPYDDASTQRISNGDTLSPDPLSSTAKSSFATANDPASPINQQSHHTNATNLTSTDADESALAKTSDEKRKKSLFEKVKGGMLGGGGGGEKRSTEDMSDEELKKYTGMGRQEFEMWKKEPANAVAGNSSADARYNATGSGGLGMGGVVS